MRWSWRCAGTGRQVSMTKKIILLLVEGPTDEDAFHVPGTYEETWKFIMGDGKSLGRYSNMAVFFGRLGTTVEEEQKYFSSIRS